MLRRSPLTTPMAVAVTVAVAGSWQPTALMVTTAPTFPAPGLASGFPTCSQKPPANIWPAQASIRVTIVLRIDWSLLQVQSDGKTPRGAEVLTRYSSLYITMPESSFG